MFVTGVVRIAVGYWERVESWMLHRMTWAEICRRDDCRGRWIALQACQFDEATGQANEGELVDYDDDLAELCRRVRSQNLTKCAIQFCSVHRPS